MAALPELDRRRLLEVRGLHPSVPVLVLHPFLTVVTGFGREASDTVVECLGRLGAPLGPAVTGSVEIDGRVLDLPGALADPDARPEVVRGPMIVGELTRRRAAEAAVDVGRRAARVSRREAGLARRDQLVDRLERLSSRAAALEQQLRPVTAIDGDDIEKLLAAARERDLSEPNPIVSALIDEWNELVAERKAGGTGPTVEQAEANLDALRARISERRLAVAGGAESEILSADGVARVQGLHADIEKLASSLEEGRRSGRRASGKEFATALDSERDALADLGFDSYSSFLLAVAEGRAEDDPAHDVAAVQAAEAALVRARERESIFALLSQRELDLRARVARLLGRVPGPDIGAALRASSGVVAPSAAIERLEAVLRDGGVGVADPIAAAEHWLAGAASRRAQLAALTAEQAEVESEGSRLDEQLEQAENELAAAERELIDGIDGPDGPDGPDGLDGSLAGTEAPFALASVAADELASALAFLIAPSGPPIVVGECFDEVTPAGRAALLDVLGDASRRRQVIVVTENDEVGAWVQDLGPGGVAWTPAEARAAQRARRENGVTRETVTQIDVPDGTDPREATAPPGIADPVAPLERVGPEASSAPPAPIPRKQKRRLGRKNAAVTPATPWESRFDTSGARENPGRSTAPNPPAGTDPLAPCMRHGGVMTRMRCARCHEPACDECMVTPGRSRKPMCIECAIRASGVRKTRRRYN